MPRPRDADRVGRPPGRSGAARQRPAAAPGRPGRAASWPSSTTACGGAGPRGSSRDSTSGRSAREPNGQGGATSSAGLDRPLRRAERLPCAGRRGSPCRVRLCGAGKKGTAAGATPFAPRTVKDLIEERLFARRRDLFSELSVVFMDTTSLSFVGAGGETLGERGYSKDHRPDLMQMIVGVVVDAAGRPGRSGTGSGSTADVSVLVPVIDRLRSRFGIGRVCVVADRGMISAPTIAALEERGLEYVLGARERTDSLVRTVVLADERPFTPLCIPRAGGEETQ